MDGMTEIRPRIIFDKEVFPFRGFSDMNQTVIQVFYSNERGRRWIHSTRTGR